MLLPPGYVIDTAGHRPPDAGAIYPEVDKYVLYGTDKRTPINVLGSDVCIEGEFLRSKEAATISEIKTDYSKCRYMDFGDESVSVKCPPGAQTKIIHHNSYLSSPLVYSVRICLEYDTSNCYLTTDQETEREMCRIVSNMRVSGPKALNSFIDVLSRSRGHTDSLSNSTFDGLWKSI